MRTSNLFEGLFRGNINSCAVKCDRTKVQVEGNDLNILVTGGFGFIGSHLVDSLTQKDPNAHIHVVDNRTSNPISVASLLEELGPRSGLTHQECSVAEFCLDDDTKWDQIYHLASVVGPAGVLAHAGRMIETIVGDTYDMIELAQRSGARLLLVSTSEVYGSNGQCREDAPRIFSSKTTVRSEYAVGKLAAETAFLNTMKVSELDGVVIRPFNISGPRQSALGGFVLPRFVGQAIRNLPLTVFGSGKQLRAFTHVTDTAEGLIAAMQMGRRGECYNIGNDSNRTTILDLADTVIRLTESQSEKVFVDPKSLYGPLYEEAPDKYPDSSKTMRDLSWRPKLSIEDVVTDTVAYMSRLPERQFLALSGIDTGEQNV